MSANRKKGALVPQNESKIKKKWWNKKKIIAFSIIGAAVLAAIIAAVVVLSTTIYPIASTEEESRVVGRFEYNAVYYDVKYEELRYVTLLNRRILDNELGEYNDLNALEQLEYEKLLEERVMEDIKSNVAILALCDEYGIRTDSLILRMRVQQDIQSFVSENFDGDAEKYKEGLKKEGLTDSLLRYTFRINRLQNKLQEYFVKNKIDVKYDETNIGEFVDYIMNGEDFVRTVHVFYPKQHPYTTEESRSVIVNQMISQGDLSDAEFEDAKRTMDLTLKEQADKYNEKGGATFALETADALAAIKNGEDRYTAIKKKIGSAPYVQGLSQDSSVSGIYFTHGQMGDAYEDAAFSLDEYGTSGVVETADGYYVVMRLPKEEETVKKNASDLLVQYQYVPLKLREDEVRAELVFLGNQDIDLLDIE